MRRRITLGCLLALGSICVPCRAEGPLLTVDLYGMMGELALDRLYFHGSGVDDAGGVHSIDARGRSLGLTGGTYYGAGSMMRFALMPLGPGTLMLGADMAGGGGGLVVGRSSSGYTPGSFGVIRVSADISWAFVSRWLLLSYGASFGGRIAFLSISGLSASSDDKGDAQALNFGSYLMTWFRPAVVFSRFQGGAAYVGAHVMIDPLQPGSREYGLSIGALAW